MGRGKQDSWRANRRISKWAWELIRADSSPERQRLAADALAATGTSRAVEALIAVLGGNDPWGRPAPRGGGYAGRALAAEALGAIGDLRAFEPLAAALGHTDYGVGKAAVTALRQLGHWADDAALLEVILGYAAKSYEATDAFADLVGSRAMAENYCVSALARGDLELRLAAVGILGQLQAASALIRTVRDDEAKEVRRRAMLALRNIAYRAARNGSDWHAPEAAGVLIPLLGDDDEGFRRWAIEALTNLHMPDDACLQQAVGTLADAMDDGSIEAARVLSRVDRLDKPLLRRVETTLSRALARNRERQSRSDAEYGDPEEDALVKALRRVRAQLE